MKGETHSGSFPMENGKSEEVKSGEEQVKEGALIATQGLGNVCVWATAMAHVWVHDPDAVMVCVDVLCSWYQQRLKG